jgi:hypothetical protein
LLFSISTSQAICVNDPQSTQPIDSDNALLANSSLSADSEKEDESLSCTLPTVTVIGYMIKNPWQPFSFFLSWVLDTHVSGGTNTGVQIPQNFGCSNGDRDGRIAEANALFTAERLMVKAISQAAYSTWIAFYGENDYTINWPDGTTGTYPVSGPEIHSNPILAESSCG